MLGVVNCIFADLAGSKPVLAQDSSQVKKFLLVSAVKRPASPSWAGVPGEHFLVNGTIHLRFVQ